MGTRTAHNKRSLAEIRQHPAVVMLFSDPSMTITRAAEIYSPPPEGAKQSTFTPELSRMVTRLEKEGVTLPPHVAERRVRRRTKAEIEQGVPPGAPARSQRAVRTYPIYGRVQAGGWNGSDQHDGDQVGTYFTDLDLPTKNGLEPFAMRVAGLSMTDNTATVEFPEGSMVLIDPGTEARAGDFVMAIDITDGTTTFKRFARLPDGTACLKPLNPAYPVITMSAYHQIVGVVAEALLPLYRR